MFQKPVMTLPFPMASDPDAIRLWLTQSYDYLVRLDRWAQTVQDQLNRFAAQAALTTADSSTVNSGDGDTDNVIENNRTRIAELEAALQAVDLL